MTIEQAFKYNPSPSYSTGSFYSKISINIIKQDIIIIIIINSHENSFIADFPNMFENYVLPHIPSEAIVKIGIQLGHHFDRIYY